MCTNKTEDLNLSVFKIITGISELTKQISCNSDQWWNNDKCQCECKKCHVCENIMFGILLHVLVKMENI